MYEGTATKAQQPKRGRSVIESGADCIQAGELLDHAEAAAKKLDGDAHCTLHVHVTPEVLRYVARFAKADVEDVGEVFGDSVRGFWQTQQVVLKRGTVEIAFLASVEVTP